MASELPSGRPRVIVVGGGVGGLVLARRLALAGREVCLLEGGDHLGGTVARHTVGGIDLDAGAESFATRGGIVARLAASLGLEEEIVTPNPVGAWVQPAGRPAFPLPENSLLGIPGSPLAPDVVAILGRRASRRAAAEAVLPGWFAAKSTTLGELVRRRMGKAVVDQLVDPIVRGVHSLGSDELNVEQVLPGIRGRMRDTGSLARAVLQLRETTARAGSAVAGIRGGVYRLVEELAADLERFGVEVRLNAPVTAVEAGRVHALGEVLTGQVVVAAPGLLPPSAPSPNLGTRVVLVTLVVDQPELDAAPRGTGVLVARGAADIQAKALTHSTAKWQWVADRAEGKHVLRLSYDDASGIAEESDAAATVELARQDAAAILGVSLEASRVLDFARVEWYRAHPQVHSPDGIRIVGESAAGTGLASVITQAESVANEILTARAG